MKVIKKTIDHLEKCYSIAPLRRKDGFHFLIAAEKHDPCYLYDEEGCRLETVWEEPGGVMTMVQVPGREDQFLATHEFYSPNDSTQARIVLATRKAADDWEIRTLVEAPFVHRFGILERGGVHYLLVCCLKSDHHYKDDWTSPGACYAAVLPEDLSGVDAEHPLTLTKLLGDLCHNHGYSLYVDHGVETGLVTCDSGVYQFIPPEERGGAWNIVRLHDQPVSDAVLCDFDGDGVPELGCLAPFHGDHLYICKKNTEGVYEKTWEYPEQLEMLHATWASTILGKPSWIVGHRKGQRDLLLIQWENGAYQVTKLDHDCGPANVFCFRNRKGQDTIIAANRETNEIAMYQISE